MSTTPLLVNINNYSLIINNIFIQIDYDMKSEEGQSVSDEVKLTVS